MGRKLLVRWILRKGEEILSSALISPSNRWAELEATAHLRALRVRVRGVDSEVTDWSGLPYCGSLSCVRSNDFLTGLRVTSIFFSRVDYEAKCWPHQGTPSALFGAILFHSSTGSLSALI